MTPLVKRSYPVYSAGQIARRYGAAARYLYQEWRALLPTPAEHGGGVS